MFTVIYLTHLSNDDCHGLDVKMIALRRFLGSNDDSDAQKMIETVVANMNQVKGFAQWNYICSSNLELFWDVTGSHPWPFLGSL